MRKRLGFSLVILGVVFFAFLFWGRVRTDTVVEDSFVLGVNEEHESFHHTQILGKSVLLGEVMVESGKVSFSVDGVNTENMRVMVLSKDFSFSIDPADDLYKFSFKNDGDDSQSAVGFTVLERWNDDAFLLRGSVISMIVSVCGFALVLASLKSRESAPAGRLPRKENV